MSTVNTLTPALIDDLCVNTLRFLAVEMVQKANSGHPGLPLGSAAMAYALWDRMLKFNPGDPNWTYDPLYTPGIPFRPVGNSLPATAAILITSYGGPMIFGPLVSMNPSIIMFRPFLNTPRTPLPPRPTEPPDWWPNVTNLPYHDPALNCPHSPGLGCHENSNCGWHISNPDAGPYLQWRKDIFE